MDNPDLGGLMLSLEEELAHDELRPLLEALDTDFPQEINPKFDHPRVCDVAEALSKDPHHVARVLAELRAREREARLVEVLTELESPLHRVERPGLSQSDPGSRHNPAIRFGTISTILDKLPQHGFSINLIKELPKETLGDKMSRFIGIAFAILVPIAIVALAVYTASHR